MYILYIQLGVSQFMDQPFQLSQADGRPMYVQIMDNIKQLILKGEWAEGEGLPSIRELAVAINVSVITVKRAYQELERENVILTRHGLGSFVAEKSQSVAHLKRTELLSAIDRVIALAEFLDMPQDKLLQLMQSQIEERNDE
ncbi:GntR family transcriptional regulator [Marinagarivorans cellulosilyticus]|uniref:GntR family transcriptional regulator n=1 Tax=Marinagarivorans cellulosilyticus TaxID=2721545 RepID=A0AAN2BKD1_9GAMM|nr:GntR family transcriptional regulator [Marinagarivorans cellulosilyticus]BCD97862.1 GntR family transcriptional regulator [Marinagarivorans cellulosilyticus]